MAGPVTCPCPPCQNPSGNQKNQSEGTHDDEDFDEQARGLAARRFGRGIATWVPQASAQNYPSHNITAIIPFAPGNANDITARIVLEQVGKQMGQAIIIDNRGGAGGTIGVGQAHAPHRTATPILFHSASFSSAYVTHKTLPTTRSRTSSRWRRSAFRPSVLVVSPSKGYKTAADLIAAAKAQAR
jgi:tripartite-type tricarboxylate transporter receptor subunit TctC